MADAASRTACSAHATASGPRGSATALAKETVASSTFLPRSPSMSSPVPVIGVAAPMLVVGAIAATWAAMAMKVPAEAACAPGGKTNVITGTSACWMRPTMPRILPMVPPGVSIRITTAAASSRSARSMPRSM